MQKLGCPQCGANKLEKKADGIYYCPYCRGNFRDEFVEEQKAVIRTLFRNEIASAKEEQIANIRSNLWFSTHEKYADSEKILTYARDLKNLLPDDFQANFYEIANSGSTRELCSFIDNIDAEHCLVYLHDVLDFLIKSLEPELVCSVKNLITRAFNGKEYTEYISKIEEEAFKIDEGLYTASLPRDVFLAYSSADMAKVNDICALLEEQGFTCFVALRNLRHGRGAVQNYQKELQTAMKNCKCVVFVSSENSRSLSCDALKIEIPYLKGHCPRIGRVEYLVEDYGKKTTVAAKMILKSFFDGLEWCRTESDLIERVVLAVTKSDSSDEEEAEVTRLMREQQEKIKRLEDMMQFNAAIVAEQRTRESALNIKQKSLEESEQRIREETERKAKEEAERKAKEEAEHKERERIAAEEKAKIETEKKTKAQAEAKAKEAERKAREEAERKILAVLSAKDYPTLENYDKSEFEIESKFFKAGTNLKKYLGKGGSVKIPRGVTEIWPHVFKDSGITEVIIPDSVTEIGRSTFSGCTGLTSIFIPNSVTCIEERAFKGCSGLTSIIVEEGNPKYHSAGNCLIETESKKLVLWCKNSVIPADGSVTAIGSYAFEGSGITDIVIPKTITSFSKYAFAGCGELKSIIAEEGNPKYHSAGNCLIDTERNSLEFGCKTSQIPADGSVRKIGGHAFYQCSGLKSIKIPYGITYVGECAFWECTGLTDLEIPDSVDAIWDMAFDGCSGLKRIVIPNRVNYIGTLAFSKCSGLKSVKIPERLTEIRDRVFEECSGLTEIVIPKAVTNINHMAFRGCSGLTGITAEEGNPKYHSAGNCLIETESKTLVLGCKNSVIPADGSVTCIGGWSFDGSGVTNIKIPNTITSIGDDAFARCVELTSIEIPQSVKSIGSSAFFYCKKLKSIKLPDGIDDYGGGQVFAYSGLERIEIPKTVTRIERGAFEYCDNLTEVVIPQRITDIGSDAFRNCSNLKKVEILGNLNSIGYNAFENCSNLSEVVIPNELPYDYDRLNASDVFADCPIKSATIHCSVLHYIKNKKFFKTVTLTGGYKIPWYAFKDCTSLESIKLSDDITEIDEEAFVNCRNLKTITIPKNVTYIGDSVFKGCKNLTVYCNVKTKPNKWSDSWDNADDNGNKVKVLWKKPLFGYKE